MHERCHSSTSVDNIRSGILLCVLFSCRAALYCLVASRVVERPTSIYLRRRLSLANSNLCSHSPLPVTVWTQKTSPTATFSRYYSLPSRKYQVQHRAANHRCHQLTPSPWWLRLNRSNHRCHHATPVQWCYHRLPNHQCHHSLTNHWCHHSTSKLWLHVI
jgi:hypothetical protein